LRGAEGPARDQVRIKACLNFTMKRAEFPT